MSEGIVKQRIVELINFLGITKKEFERTTGLSNGFVDKAGNSLRNDKVDRILSTYPELNRDWLLFGEGSMLRQPESAPPAVDTPASVSGVSPDIQSLIAEISAQRRLTETALQQMNKLLEVVDRLTASVERLVAPPERVAR